ncbi:MAG: hypothetical protein JWR26_590 [Pedosphaera sp.]|nr:hypothetical protein [Pedosphaera sp.]
MNVNYSSQCLRTATMGAGKTGVLADGHRGNRGEFNHIGVCTRVFPHGASQGYGRGAFNHIDHIPRVRDRDRKERGMKTANRNWNFDRIYRINSNRMYRMGVGLPGGITGGESPVGLKLLLLTRLNTLKHAWSGLITLKSGVIFWSLQTATSTRGTMGEDHEGLIVVTRLDGARAMDLVDLVDGVDSSDRKDEGLWLAQGADGHKRARIGTKMHKILRVFFSWEVGRGIIPSRLIWLKGLPLSRRIWPYLGGSRSVSPFRNIFFVSLRTATRVLAHGHHKDTDGEDLTTENTEIT